MSDSENRENDGSRRPSDALQDSLEELSRLADTLVDGLADEFPDDVPEEAAPPAESARGESLHQALVDLDELDEIDAPQKQVEVELEGDRGDDIDAHLDALFGDGGETAAPAVLETADDPTIESDPDDDLDVIEFVDSVEETTPIELPGPIDAVDDTDPEPFVETVEPDELPDLATDGEPASSTTADEIRVDFYDAQMNRPSLRDELETEAEEAIDTVQASAKAETEVLAEPEAPVDSSRSALWAVAAILLFGLTAGVWALLSGSLDGLIGKTAATAAGAPSGETTSTGPANVDRLARPAHTESLMPLPVAAKPEPVAVVPEPVAVKPEPIAVKPEPVAVKPEPVAAVIPEPIAPEPAEVQLASIVPETNVPEAELPSEIAVEVPRIVQPIPLERIEPVYSARARARGESGTVVLNILVNEQGRVVRVVVDQGIPGSDLEAAAIDAVLRWDFRPAKEDGRPIRAWVTERFVFEP